MLLLPFQVRSNMESREILARYEMKLLHVDDQPRPQLNSRAWAAQVFPGRAQTNHLRGNSEGSRRISS